MHIHIYLYCVCSYHRDRSIFLHQYLFYVYDSYVVFISFIYTVYLNIDRKEGIMKALQDIPFEIKGETSVTFEKRNYQYSALD